MFDFPVTKMYMKAKQAPVGTIVNLSYDVANPIQADLVNTVADGLVKVGYQLMHYEQKGSTVNRSYKRVREANHEREQTATAY
jgi:hypothetical protein